VAFLRAKKRAGKFQVTGFRFCTILKGCKKYNEKGILHALSHSTHARSDL
jgi:hypothetical protein